MVTPRKLIPKRTSAGLTGTGPSPEEGREHWLKVEEGTTQSRCLTSRVGGREVMLAEEKPRALGGVAATGAVRGLEGSGGGSAGGKEAEKRARLAAAAAGQAPAEVLWQRWESLHG